MKRHVNYYFLITVIVLLSCGILFLSTLSAILSLQFFGNSNYYLFHQLISIFIGLIAAFITFKLPLDFLKKISLPLLILSLILLVIVFLPFLGLKIWGAQRWISIGGNTFQPSELFKITAILYVSAWLSNRLSESTKKEKIPLAKKTYYNFIKLYVPFFLLISIISVLLILQRDLSTLGITIIALLAIYFFAGTPVWHTILTFAIGISSAITLIKIEPYRLRRLLVFLNPETDPLGIGFHLRQALIALGSGGIIGKGLGVSTQKFGFLPQAMSDSIFAIIGEEVGIIGASFLVLLFVVFFWQGIVIANRTNDKFAKLTAIGISVWITTQAFVNIASTIGIFPLSGVPLPFFSYGGSHIIAELIGVGLLLNISKNG